MTDTTTVKKLKVNHIKASRQCPRCFGKIVGYPAMHRQTGEDVCSPCGLEEAVVDWELSGVPQIPFYSKNLSEAKKMGDAISKEIVYLRSFTRRAKNKA